MATNNFLLIKTVLKQGIRDISFRKKPVLYKPGTMLIETLLSRDSLYNNIVISFWIGAAFWT